MHCNEILNNHRLPAPSRKIFRGLAFIMSSAVWRRKMWLGFLLQLVVGRCRLFRLPIYLEAIQRFPRPAFYQHLPFLRQSPSLATRNAVLSRLSGWHLLLFWDQPFSRPSCRYNGVRSGDQSNTADMLMDDLKFPSWDGLSKMQSWFMCISSRKKTQPISKKWSTSLHVITSEDQA